MAAAPTAVHEAEAAAEANAKAEAEVPGSSGAAAQGSPAPERRTAVKASTEPAAAARADSAPAATRRGARGNAKEAENLFPFSVMVGRVYDGPLDLLLDLIRKQDIDIWDIPIARITAQFLAYVERLKETDVDNAGEFIYTASLLIHIKSRMLLPRAPAETLEDAEDPRMELVERLLEHERFKNAAQMLLQKQQIEAATWTRPQLRSFLNTEAMDGEIAADVPDLVRVMRDVLERIRTKPVLDVQEDSVTVGQMIDYVRRRLLMEDGPVALSRMLSNTRSERALICMFLALLEMVRLQAVLLRQDRNFAEVLVKKQDGFEQLMEERMKHLRDDWQ
ncbi:ScpA family protein [Acidipila sp. EB88]|uniref:segregation and condensation protein A n=1 Tax=Acidipila sp. EB88 TaxID=2305226 RepID=UPI001F385267|nr:segregation/condensation protein A [Acidipila sp. EB88]